MKHLIFIILVLSFFAFNAHCQRTMRNSEGQIVQLSKPNVSSQMSVEEVLAKRRSVREFQNQLLDFTQIGQLAWAAQGITEPVKGFRTAPSAGAIYPMKLYFATPDGLFFYQPKEHSLRQVTDADVRNRLSEAALGQTSVAKSPCNIIIAGSVRKVAEKYNRKARDFILLEAGHIAQNIHLQAVSLGLGSVPVGAFNKNPVRKICRLTNMMEPFYIIPVGYPVQSESKETIEMVKEAVEMNNTGTKKAVLIIASSKFRDEELFETKSALEQADVQTVIASSRTGTIKGMLGGKAGADILVNDLIVDDYDAVVFVGGAGAKEYFNSQVALNIAREAKDKNKVLAAICIAPAILANAGLLEGVKATCYSSERVRLKKAGAEFTGSDVEQDGLIITGSGPQAATEFGQTIAKALQEK